MKLDKRSSVPLYAQLKELLIERVESGAYPPGTRILPNFNSARN